MASAPLTMKSLQWMWLLVWIFPYGSWSLCTDTLEASNSVPLGEVRALMSMSTSMGNNTKLNWESLCNRDVMPCTENEPWDGVTCTDINNTPHVTTISFDDFPLYGPLPMELAHLPELVTLAFTNCLFGSLTEGICGLQHLEMVDLTCNGLRGPIPTCYGTSIPSLQTLRLGCPSQSSTTSQGNQNTLSGVIPWGLGELPSLQELNLENNNLVGWVPPGLCDVKTCNAEQDQTTEQSFWCPIPGNQSMCCGSLTCQWFNLTSVDPPSVEGKGGDRMVGSNRAVIVQSNGVALDIDALWENYGPNITCAVTLESGGYAMAQAIGGAECDLPSSTPRVARLAMAFLGQVFSWPGNQTAVLPIVYFGEAFAPFCITIGEGASGAPAIAGVAQAFYIQSRDINNQVIPGAYAQRVTYGVEITGPNGFRVEEDPFYAGDGLYTVEFVLTVKGTYRVAVALVYDGIEVPIHNGGFHKVVIASDPYAAHSSGSGGGLKSAVVNEKQEFKIALHDRFGNPLDVGGAHVEIEFRGVLHGSGGMDSLKEMETKVEDQNDGTYLISYVPPMPDTINATLNGTTIDGFPVRVTATGRLDPGVVLLIILAAVMVGGGLVLLSGKWISKGKVGEARPLIAAGNEKEQEEGEEGSVGVTLYSSLEHSVNQQRLPRERSVESMHGDEVYQRVGGIHTEFA